MKPRNFRFFQDIFNRLFLLLQIIVYPGKQLHIVLILTSDERTGFLTALSHRIFCREYIADLFHQIDPQDRGKCPVLLDPGFSFSLFILSFIISLFIEWDW